MPPFLCPLIVVICTIDAAYATCEKGSVQGVKWTECYSLHYASLGWFEAEMACRLRGGHLAPVADASVNELLNELSHNWCYEDYWLGASNVENNSWRWVDGSTFGYQNWALGQPARNNTQVSCLAASTLKSTWHATVCDQPKPFFCFINLSSGGSLPTSTKINPTEITHSHLAGTTPRSRPQCPFGWDYNSGTRRCLRAVSSRSVWDYSWNASICGAVDGQIVSIHSALENGYITSYAFDATQPWKSGNSQVFFIGLHAPNAKWVWTDESSFDFANWTAHSAFDHCDGTNDCAVAVWLTSDSSYGSWIAYNYDNFPYYGTKTICAMDPFY